MKTKYTFILILVFKIFVGQNDATNTYNNQIKLSPVRLFTTVRGIQLSYERQFSERFSTQLTGARIIDVFPYHFNDITNLKGYLIGIEEKYFLKRKKNYSNYVSVDLTYLSCSLNKAATFTYKPTNDSLSGDHSDTILIKRKTSTLSFKYGFQYYYKRLIIDINIGLGIRYRDVTHFEKLYPDAVWWRGIHASTPTELFISGQYYTFNIPLGLKIGYRF